MYLYQRIKDIRMDKDKGQKEIAELLGTTQQQYSKYENGIQEMPAHHIITLSNYYKISADYILGLTNESKPYPRA